MGKKRYITNLGEKIYFLTYAKPMYKLEISKALYGEESKIIYPEIKQLENKGWIEHKTRMTDADAIKADGRAGRRQYYRATVKPMLEIVIEDLKQVHVTIEDDEKKKIADYLDGEHFRKKINSYSWLFSPEEKASMFAFRKVILFDDFGVFSFLDEYCKKSFETTSTDLMRWFDNLNILGVTLVRKLVKAYPNNPMKNFNFEIIAIIISGYAEKKGGKEVFNQVNTWLQQEREKIKK